MAVRAGHDWEGQQAGGHHPEGDGLHGRPQFGGDEQAAGPRAVPPRERQGEQAGEERRRAQRPPGRVLELRRAAEVQEGRAGSDARHQGDREPCFQAQHHQDRRAEHVGTLARAEEDHRQAGAERFRPRTWPARSAPGPRPARPVGPASPVSRRPIRSAADSRRTPGPGQPHATSNASTSVCSTPGPPSNPAAAGKQRQAARRAGRAAAAGTGSPARDRRPAPGCPAAGARAGTSHVRARTRHRRRNHSRPRCRRSRRTPARSPPPAGPPPTRTPCCTSRTRPPPWAGPSRRGPRATAGISR